MKQARSTPTTAQTLPELSVVVPTYARNQTLEQLLMRCNQQTLAPRRFEVIVVDDGSPQPVRLQDTAYRFALKLLRQENAGPAAARNLALEHCRGALVLFLNDDSVPAFDLFEKHLEVHATRSDKVAVLGTFDFTAESLRHPFVQVLNDSDLLFDYIRMRDGALHPWQYFWTCNISLPLAALREVGGFDAQTFPEAIVEDVELGFRLAKKGYSILFRKDLACEHDHVLTVDKYFARAVRLGVNTARLWGKHGQDPMFKSFTGLGIHSEPNAATLTVTRALSITEAYYSTANDFLEKMRATESKPRTGPLAAGLLAQLRSMTRRLAYVPYYRGQLMQTAGFDPEPVMRDGAAHGKLVSIVVVSYDALEQTRACLARLRETRDANHPTEIIFVDNGSSDGSAEFLAAATDVKLLRNNVNLGAPRARNQALPHARGEYVVFLDNDAMVTPDWLARLLYHAEVNPLSGCIAPTSDRAAHGQQVVMTCATDPESIARFARETSRDLNRQHFHAPVLSSFCMLVPRRVLDAIGGFDERFSPWGYEDDDFTLRATLAGFQNRCARDVFVRHEAYKGRSKLERHSELLQANWERFATKWGLALESASKSDQRLAPVLAVPWTARELCIPIDGAHQPALLPQPSPANSLSPKK
ncbi:MAG TPA: glycosyltransferase [Planctomycetota bacterium]|nr:glycosyltransferase [Planctomycetota bacterium]